MPTRSLSSNAAADQRQIVRGEARLPAVSAPDRAAKGATDLPFDPYRLGQHGTELLGRGVMLAPVLVVWRYRIADAAAFTGWLATKEILLSEARMALDPEIRGIRYGGTYRLAADIGGTGWECKTIWGYASEAAMAKMHQLGSGAASSATLIQLELIDFLTGLRRLIGAAGEQHFAQEVLIAAQAAGGGR